MKMTKRMLSLALVLVLALALALTGCGPAGGGGGGTTPPAAELEYAQGTGDWAAVETAFVDGWATEYAAANK